MKKKTGMKNIDPLVGKFFHSVKADRETISWQGQVTARIGDSYLVQLYEWFVGAESNQTLIPAVDMAYWRFYDSVQEMNNHYRDYCLQQIAAKKEIPVQEGQEE